MLNYSDQAEDDAVEDHLLIGQGSYLHILQNKTVIKKIQTFIGSVVHQLRHFTDEVVVLGGKSVMVLSYPSLDIKQAEISLPDWLWDCLKLGRNYFFLTAHNKVIKTDKQFNILQTFGCEEKCILYSGLLLADQARMFYRLIVRINLR